MHTKTAASSPRRPVWFPDWAEVLSRSGLPVSIRQQYRNTIVEFLRFCQQSRQGATVASARQFMQEREAQRRLGAADLAAWKAGVNWFFREAGKSGSVRPGPVLRGLPPLAAADLGASAWEQRLIRELRRRHYRWRTEQTYRLWAGRFVRWLEARGQRWDQAAEVEIREFLSELATRQRASVSAQKQALNALVFLVREALGRTLEAFGDFTRARPARRVPVVLTQDECRRLFAALEGVPRLMAELMSGSGLRLTELLGLRVKDVDLERRQILVRAGKGDRDRATVVPESLVDRLRAQRERLRGLHAEDQCQGVPGVWLPEGLERKWPRAGEQWEWQWFFPSRQLMHDPRTGLRRRHHVLDATFQHMIRQAARRARLDKRVTPHVLRQNAECRKMPSEAGRSVKTLVDSSVLGRSARHFQRPCKNVRSLSPGR